MRFNYQARTKQGEMQSGVIEASSPEAAVRILQNVGLFVTNLQAVEAIPFYVRKIKPFQRVSKKEIMVFTRQLAVLFKAGVPLIESLETLAAQSTNFFFREKVLEFTEKIKGGSTLSQALANYPKIFSTFYVNMLKSGESSGKMSEVLSYLSAHLQRENFTNSKIKGAMIYPAFIIVVFSAVLLLMAFFVLPQLIPFFQESGQTLPLPTRVIIAGVGFLRAFGWLVLVVIIILVIALFKYYKSPSGKRFFDEYFLKLPVFGSFLKMVYMSRFAENLATLISGGLPIVKALDITGDVVGSDVYKDIISQVKEGVRKGETIHSVLRKYPKEISPLFYQMSLIGEKTGKIVTLFENLSDFYQKETDIKITTLLGMIEPLLIVILGLGVGIFIASILIPIYQMTVTM